MSDVKKDCKIGYGKPPWGRPVQKGQSGNPRRKDLSPLIAVLNEPVYATINGKRRKITKREAIIKQMVDEPASIQKTDKKVFLMLRRPLSEAEEMFSPVVSGNVHRRDATVAAWVDAQRRASKNATIRARCAASGSRPLPAPRLSAICCALLVPGITAVTASLPSRYLRKNWPQLAASKSAAHSGSLCPRTAPKSRLWSKGISVNTAAPTSTAAGIIRFSAARSPSE
jgi:Family of unknown function (DUF5681)